MAGLAIGGACSSVQALEPHKRPQSVFGLALGVGSSRIGLDLGNSGTIESERQVGFGFGFRLGPMVRPDLALTLEGSGWSRRYNNMANQRLIPTTVTVSVVGGALTYYPARSGFYVRGGLGLSTGSVSLVVSGLNFDRDKYGIGLLGGVGYELRLGQSFAMGPSIDFGGTRMGTATHGGVTVDFDLTYVNFGITANWYPPKKKRRDRPRGRGDGHGHD